MKLFLSILILLILATQGKANVCNDNNEKSISKIFIAKLGDSVINISNGILDEQDNNDFNSPDLNIIQAGKNILLLQYFVTKTVIFFPLLYNNFLQNFLIDLPPPCIL